MKKLNKITEQTQTLNGNTSRCYSEVDQLLLIDAVESYETNGDFTTRITSDFENIFVLSSSLYVDECGERGNYNHVLSHLADKIEVGLLPGVVPSERKIIEIILNNFEGKYIIPFLLHSAGCKYEEIASALLLPINVVRSRVFYVEKRMQMLLKHLTVSN